MKIGFIGLGNMADAMIGGIIGKGLYGKSDIIGSSKTEATAVKISEKYGIETCTDNVKIAQEADVVILAVKPVFFPEVIAQIKDKIKSPERIMDAVIAVSGSSPAYVFVFIEAMADAAVQAGMPRKQAYEFAAQSVLGSAKMVLETGKHPAELKDMVCSPGGTTIEAVKVLEEKGFRAAVIDAMEACAEKSRNM